MVKIYKLTYDDAKNILKNKIAKYLSQNKINRHYLIKYNDDNTFLNETYEDNNIEEDYKNIIELYRKFFHLRELIKTVRTVELSEKEPLCTICFNEQIQFAIVPCGHTYCSTCIKRHVLTCSVCRGNIRDRIRVYFT